MTTEAKERESDAKVSITEKARRRSLAKCANLISSLLKILQRGAPPLFNVIKRSCSTLAVIVIAFFISVLGFIFSAKANAFWLATFIFYIVLAVGNLRASATINRLEIAGEEKEVSAMRAAALSEAERNFQLKYGGVYPGLTRAEYIQQIEDYNSTLKSFKTVAAGFNTEAMHNSYVLLIASASLFIAAFIALVQGIGFI